MNNDRKKIENGSSYLSFTFCLLFYSSFLNSYIRYFIKKIHLKKKERKIFYPKGGILTFGPLEHQHKLWIFKANLLVHYQNVKEDIWALTLDCL